MAEDVVLTSLPEGSTEVPKLVQEARRTNGILSAILNLVSTLLVIVFAGVILKALDFTSAKETEFNDKAHAFADSALSAQFRFSEAANNQRVAENALERAMLTGQDPQQVNAAVTEYDNSYTRYVLALYNLMRLSDGGDIRHFAPDDYKQLQGYTLAPLKVVKRHHDCLVSLGEYYVRDQSVNGSGTGDDNPSQVLCRDARENNRLYQLDDELNLLASCETLIGRRVYSLADKLTSDGWRRVGGTVDGSPSLLSTYLRNGSDTACANLDAKAVPGMGPDSNTLITRSGRHNPLAAAPTPTPVEAPAQDGVAQP